MSENEEPLSGSRQATDRALVKLSLPATPEFVQVARLTIAALANRAAFTFDEVDDLRIAIDELSAVLVRVANPGAELELRFALAPGELVVDGALSSMAEGQMTPGLPELTEKILEVVVDEYMLLADGQSLAFKLTKSHVPLDADS